MDNQQSNTLSEEPQQMMSGDSKKKLLSMVGGALLILIVVIVFALVLSKSKKDTTQQQQTVDLQNNSSSGKDANSKVGFGRKIAATSNTQSNSEMSSKILKWVEAQKDSRGIYYLDYTCKGTACEKPNQGNQTGVEPIWGRYIHFVSTKDNKDMEVIKKDLSTYTDKNINPTIQNTSWNCKLMFDIWKNPALSPDVKQKVEDYCFNGSYITVMMDDTNNVTDTIDFEKIKKGQDAQLVIKAEKNRLGSYSAAASDYITQYLWKNQSYNIDLARMYYYFAISAYSQSEDKNNPDIPYLGVASLDMYKATHNNKYLNFANYLYSQQNQKTCLDAMQCIVMSFFSQELYDLSKNPKYIESRDNSLNYIIENGYDAVGYKGSVNNNNAIHEINTGTDLKYDIQTNALMMGLLLKNK